MPYRCFPIVITSISDSEMMISLGCVSILYRIEVYPLMNALDSEVLWETFFLLSLGAG